MKTTIIAFTCALSSAACAGADNPPARDATSARAEPDQSLTASSNTSPAPASADETPPPAPSSTSPGSASMMGTGSTTSNPPAGAPVPVVVPPTSVVVDPGAGDHTGAADNTKQNARDRRATLTPIDQGNSKAEIAITAAIRRGVMGDRSLSFTAKNVKIITVGTRVTLRGPVKSDAERTTIENLARQTAGVTDVDDQLEVKN